MGGEKLEVNIKRFSIENKGTYLPFTSLEVMGKL
jgi:hypothetical protein